MKTWKTLEEAQAATEPAARVIEIEHATEGVVFIRCKAPLEILDKALAANPMPEVVRTIAEYPAKSEAVMAAEREQRLRDNCSCERCGKKIDGNTSYSQKEWMRISGAKVSVIAYYCQSCERLLKNIGLGERTDMQARAAYVPPAEPYTKDDH